MVEIVGETEFSVSDLKIAGKLFCAKLTAAHSYTPSNNFHGSVTLFKATDGFSVIDEAYGLAKVRSISA